jgi:hypothetical protein
MECLRAQAVNTHLGFEFGEYGIWSKGMATGVRGSLLDGFLHCEVFEIMDA